MKDKSEKKKGKENEVFWIELPVSIVPGISLILIFPEIVLSLPSFL